VTSSLVRTRDASLCFGFRHEDDGTLTVLHGGQEFNLSTQFGF
jgi:hypothetical protein